MEIVKNINFKWKKWEIFKVLKGSKILFKKNNILHKKMPYH